MNDNDILKRYGWDNDQLDTIKHIVNTTGDSSRHLIFRMAIRPQRSDFFGGIANDDEYYVRVFDRRDLTHYERFRSKPFRTRDKVFKRYCDLLHYFKLPHCCPNHRDEDDPPLGNFLDNDHTSDFFGKTFQGFFQNSSADEDPGSALESFFGKPKKRKKKKKADPLSGFFS